MVRKVMVVCIALAVVLCAAAPARAATPDIYDGTISTSMLDYFSDILTKVNPLKNYVLIRSSQYIYLLYVGDFEWDGNRFSCDSAEVYSITTNSGYNSHYTFNQSTITDLTIIPGDYLIYSDLGPYPVLRDPAETWSFAICVLISILLFCNLLRSILLWRD